MLISEAFEEYIRIEIISIGGSYKTVESYQNSKKLAVKYFGDIKVENISLINAQEYRLWLAADHKINTVRGHICCIRSVLRFCKRRGEPVVDASEIKTPRREKKATPFLTKDEVNAFIQTASRKRRGYAEINRIRNILIIKMLFETGLRVSELCSLDQNDIKDNTFSVIGKSKNARVCFITDELSEEISEYLKMRNDDNPALFITNETKKRIAPSNVQEMFRRLCRKYGQAGIHPHILRHSFATYMLNNGVGIREIAELLGHESLDTTKIYTHIANPKLHEIYNQVMARG